MAFFGHSASRTCDHFFLYHRSNSASTMRTGPLTSPQANGGVFSGGGCLAPFTPTLRSGVGAVVAKCSWLFGSVKNFPFPFRFHSLTSLKFWFQFLSLFKILISTYCQKKFLWKILKYIIFVHYLLTLNDCDTCIIGLCLSLKPQACKLRRNAYN
jgi:hypothetical protein